MTTESGTEMVTLPDPWAWPLPLAEAQDRRQQQRRTDDSQQIRELIDTIRDVEGAIVDHREQLIITDRRSRWARRQSITSLIAAIIGIAIGIGVFKLANDIVDQRDDSRKISCVQANVNALRSRLADHDSALITADNIAPPQLRDKEVQSRVEFYVYQQDTKSQLRNPFRDCSKEGIAGFLHTPQRDPAHQPLPPELVHDPPPTTVPVTED